MGPPKSGAKIDLVASSGMLRVTVHPKPHWYTILIELTVTLVFAAMMYRNWPKMSLLFHMFFIWGLISAVLALIFQLSGTQIMEFDSQNLTVCKEIHGWERKKEYKIEDCSELEWTEGSEGRREGLKCKVGWKRVTFCDNLSEGDTIEVLTALQRSLPDVAQKICTYPASGDHFLTLGLGKQK